MAHMTPNYRQVRVAVDPESVPVQPQVPIKQQVKPKAGPSQTVCGLEGGRVTS